MIKYRFPIVNLYHCMWSFYERFNLLPPTKLAVALKLNEEIDEFIVAMHHESDERIAEEAADVIAVIVGGCIACGLDENDIMLGIINVIKKNNAKTHDTHKRENGTIVRINHE